MIPYQRRERIVQLLRKRNVLSVSELTELLGVSHMTVRRDIQALEKSGQVLAVTGGVRSLSPLRTEPSQNTKTQLELPAKRAIARCAADMVHDDSTVYLDAGTTSLQMVPMLSDRTGLTVVTNDLNVALHLTEYPHIALFHAGGSVDHANHSTVGHFAADFIRQIKFDIAFVSSSSWDGEVGSTTPAESKVPVKRQVLQNSTTSVLIADSSKYKTSGAFRVASLTEFALVITDERLPDADRAKLESDGVAMRTVTSG